MKAIRALALTAVLGLELGLSTPLAPAEQGSQAAPQATEVGVTSTTIRIAVVADVSNSIRPGLFASVPAAVRAFATYINQHGGLAGRRVAVDFIDSHLSNSEARNAMITACGQDFALVGTAALFLSNVDDMVGCKDRAGAATGIPDLPIVTTEIVQQCSPISFPVNPPQVDCATRSQRPQTYRVNRGAILYYERTRFHNLHGIGVYSNDIRSAAASQQVLIRGANAGGVKPDGEFGLSALSPQAAYTVPAQAMVTKNSNYGMATSTYDSTISLRREAVVQGVNSQNVVWDCFSQCYDREFLSSGGSAVEGQYVILSQIPFEEAKSNAALANYVKYTGQPNIAGFGAYAWISSLLFRDAVNAVVTHRGRNGLNRRALLDALASETNFDADGMWGTTDVAHRAPSPCFLVMQVQHGQFKRVYPAQPGTFDCKPSNRITIREDLQTG
jgi:hypothetical protein